MPHAPRTDHHPRSAPHTGSGRRASRRSDLQAIPPRGRVVRTAFGALAAIAAPLFAQAQQEPPLLDVQHYAIDARIDLDTQMLEATVEMHFTPARSGGHRGLRTAQRPASQQR